MRKNIISMEEWSDQYEPCSPEQVAPQPPVLPENTVSANVADQIRGIEVEIDDDYELRRADATLLNEQRYFEATENGVDNIVALTRIADELETDPDRKDMVALQVAVEHFYRELDISKLVTKRVTMSAESFADKDSRVKASLEEASNIRENLKKAGATIIEALKKVLMLAAKFFDQLFSSALSLKKKNEKLHRDAEDLKGQGVDGKVSLNPEKFYPVLLVGGKYIEGKAVLATFDKYTKNKALNTDWFGLWDSSKISNFLEDREKALKAVLAVKDREMKGEAGTHYSTDLLFASSQFNQFVADDGGYKSSIDTTTERDPMEKCVPLNPDDILKLTDAIDTHLSKYENMNGEITRFFQGAIAAFSKASTETGEDGKSPADLKKDFEILRQMTYANGAMLQRFDLKVCKFLMTYCEESLKALHPAKTDAQ